MKVAWISPYLPEPATSGGAIRQQRLAAAMTAHAQVHLFARGDPWEQPRKKSPELASFASVWLGRDYLPRPWRCPSRRVRNGSAASMYRQVADLHRQISLDLVVVAHSWGALGAQEIGVPWLLDEHNVESRYFADVDRAKGQWGPRAMRRERAMQQWEQWAWKHATAVSCVTESDAHTIGGFRSPGQPPLVIANGAKLSHLAAREAEHRRGGVLFVGSMGYRPNVDAAARLIGQILPMVWQTRPDLQLTVVGGPVPEALQAARANLARERQPLVHLVGRVPDLAAYMGSAEVFANPMVHGAGSSLKVIEALAFGVPLVSSELGARGFGLLAGTDYVAAETDAQQADAIVRVVGDRGLTLALSTSGRALAAKYDWTALGARFVTLAEHTAREKWSPVLK